jgi:hypothetical protein
MDPGGETRGCLPVVSTRLHPLQPRRPSETGGPSSQQKSRARASLNAPPVAEARATCCQPAVSSERSGPRRHLRSVPQRDRSPLEMTRRENISNPRIFPACTTYRC